MTRVVRSLLLVAALWPALFAAPAAAQPEPAAPPAEAVEAPAPAPAAPTYDSPRAAMFAFLEAYDGVFRLRDEASWDAVFATFDAPPDMGADDRRAAADALHETLDKLGTVTEDQLPDAEDLRAEAITRFTYFPGRPDQRWVWEDLAPFARFPVGKIELVELTSGDWRFSQATVRGATALAASLEPLPPKHFAPVAEAEESEVSKVARLLGPTFSLTPWWAWLSLLGCIFGGLVAGRIVKGVLERIETHWRKSGRLVRAVGAAALANPASLALLTLGLNVGLVLFILLGDTKPFVDACLKFLYLISVGWLLWNLISVIEMALRRITSRTANRLDDMVVPLVRRSLRILLVVMFTLFVAQNVFGLNITGWLAGLGIAGLAVSLAAQDSVKNLFGWATVLFDRPFAVGDAINFGGVSGTVEDIGFRSTRLRLASGASYSIPNMKWIDGMVENVTARGAIRRDFNLGLAYDNPIEKIHEAVRIVEDLLLNDPEVVRGLNYDPKTQRPQVNIDDFRTDAVNLKVSYWYSLVGSGDRNHADYLRNGQAINLKILQRLEEAGIDVIFPGRPVRPRQRA